MARKKTGRAAAEAAYADLLKENTSLVGDVGEAWDVFAAKLEDAVAARDRYEEARAAAVKGGAVTNDQLDQMGYRKTPKMPALPDKTTVEPAAAATAAPANSAPEHTNGAGPHSELAPVGANLGGHS
jgi:hypothetical protein